MPCFYSSGVTCRIATQADTDTVQGPQQFASGVETGHSTCPRGACSIFATGSMVTKETNRACREAACCQPNINYLPNSLIVALLWEEECFDMVPRAIFCCSPELESNGSVAHLPADAHLRPGLKAACLLPLSFTRSRSCSIPGGDVAVYKQHLLDPF